MAIPANAVLTFGMVGIREDLTDLITNVDPTETPFYSAADKRKVRAQYHEWQTDTLAAANGSNKHAEGDDSTLEARSPTTRVGNRCQISKKIYGVSGSAQAAPTAGRKDELGYIRMKAGLELRRDMETILTGSQASSTGATATGASLGALENWLSSNYTGNSGAGTTPGFSSGNVAAVVDSTVTATFVESDLQTLLQSIWTNGGDPDVIMLGAFNKRQASKFAGIATQYRDNPQVGPGVTIGATDVYVSDWGEVAFVPNRFSRGRTVHALQMDKFAVGMYRPMKIEKLAKTGDSEKEHMLCEYTLIVDNEKASGKIVDRATS